MVVRILNMEILIPSPLSGLIFIGHGPNLQMSTPSLGTEDTIFEYSN